ncbi:MAG: primosomal protein N' [Candidatus Eremiobacteraeota bacterium]|nr:primosomal protein N' [Candidatus Eremiobacteraeota bacterium]
MNASVRRTRVIDVLPAIRTSKFDLPLTYDTGGLALGIGDVVRVPLGKRETLGYVVSEAATIGSDARLRPISARAEVPAAFSVLGLKLARWISEQYLCTLREALSAVILTAALPRSVDRLTKTSQMSPRANLTVPQQLLDVIWSDLGDSFSVETLLRHPHARRAGERAILLRAINALVRGGSLKRERTFVGPRMHEYRVRVLQPGPASLGGLRLNALLEFVQKRPGVQRADALLAGFSPALITRAVKAAALLEEEVAPPGGRERRPAHPPQFHATPEQAHAIDRIDRMLLDEQFAAALLHGITGSGKTFVYIEAIKRVVDRGGRALVLVPEISLTPQTVRRFEDVFGRRVAVLHSALSERERYDAWHACERGEVDVVVGARSAVFAPLPSVRLLIVDEAHESSYKQDVAPRYNAIAVARYRMQLERGILLLGSATPSLESFAAARSGRLALLQLPRRATNVALPATRIVDMRAEFESGNRRIFSSEFTRALATRLERGDKAVLFVNRRGSAGFMLCRDCGYVPKCRSCSVSMTVHRSENLLRCHYCDAQSLIPTSCSKCRSVSIREFGVGTQTVVKEVERLFPTARIVRMDSDTTTRVGDHARLLRDFETNADVLVGTQMVAKGLDFPQVTLVGVVAADIGLHVVDFRATERAFSLMIQVCGRSGRAGAGEAFIQTYAPQHPAVVAAAQHDYDGFAQRELSERKAIGYPPFKRLVYVGIIGRNRSGAAGTAQHVAQMLRGNPDGEVLGPAPYPIARLNTEWRFRIAIKTGNVPSWRSYIREHILPIARANHLVRFTFNVDP